jgi:hypothetical protein
VPAATKYYCGSHGGGGIDNDTHNQFNNLSAGATTALNEVGVDSTGMMLMTGGGGMMMSTNNPSRGGGGYTQTMMVPQTQIIDFIDRKQLVRELYKKKVMFKSFIGWVQLV